MKYNILLGVLIGFVIGALTGVGVALHSPKCSVYYKTDLSRKEMSEALKKVVKIESGYAMIIPGDTTVMPYLIKAK